MRSAWIIGVAAAAVAGTAQAAEVVFNGVVARVVVVPENRADIAVQVQPGQALPAPRVRREGDRVIVEAGHDVRGCNTGRNGTQIRLKGGERLSLAGAPVVTVRAPRSFSLTTRGSNAISGQVGPTQNLQLASGGCSRWTLGDVAGSLSLTQSGGSSATAGRAGAARITASGGGTVTAGQVRDLQAQASGGGVVRVAGVAGPMSANASGGGGVRVEGGRTGLFQARASGGGWVNYRGVAEGLDAAASGGGRVQVAQVTGPVNRRRTSGGGVVTVGD